MGPQVRETDRRRDERSLKVGHFARLGACTHVSIPLRCSDRQITHEIGMMKQKPDCAASRIVIKGRDCTRLVYSNPTVGVYSWRSHGQCQCCQVGWRWKWRQRRAVYRKQRSHSEGVGRTGGRTFRYILGKTADYLIGQATDAPQGPRTLGNHPCSEHRLCT